LSERQGRFCIGQKNSNLSELKANESDGNKTMLDTTYDYNNPFIAPSDGYIGCYRSMCSVYGSNQTPSASTTPLAELFTTNVDATASLFVRKGMKICVSNGGIAYTEFE